MNDTEYAHHAGPWGKAAHFGEDDVAHFVRLVRLLTLRTLFAHVCGSATRLGREAGAERGEGALAASEGVGGQQ